MAIIDCPHCGEVVSNNSDTCIYCKASLTARTPLLFPRASSSQFSSTKALDRRFSPRRVRENVERAAVHRANTQTRTERKDADDLTEQISQDAPLSGRHKPEYADFLLTYESATNARERRENRGKAASRIGVVVAGSAGLYFAHTWLAPKSIGDWLITAFAAWGIGAGGLIGLAITYFLISWLLLKKLDPEVYRLGKLEDAQKSHAQWELRTARDFWMSLNPVRFEQEVAALYRSEGYSAQLTPRSGDKGIDIFLANAHETLIVQCKTNEKPVGPNIARELVGTLELTKCDGAILVSRSGFTNGVYEVANARSIRLVGLQDILGMARR